MGWWMATGRRRHFRVADSFLIEPWDNDTVASLVRLMAYLNTRWARDNIPTEKSGTAAIRICDLMGITGKKRADIARKSARRWAEVASISVQHLGDLTLIDWPNFVKFQHESLHHGASWDPQSALSSTSTVKEEEKNSRPIARAKPSLGPPSAESPVWMGRIWGVLPTLPLLYRPDLCDWGWWAQIHLAYPLDNGKIDIVHELKKMQAYYATNEAKRPKKNWKNATRKWINNAILGPSWMKPGASDRDRFFKELGS